MLSGITSRTELQTYALGTGRCHMCSIYSETHINQSRKYKHSFITFYFYIFLICPSSVPDFSPSFSLSQYLFPSLPVPPLLIHPPHPLSSIPHFLLILLPLPASSFSIMLKLLLSSLILLHHLLLHHLLFA